MQMNNVQRIIDSLADDDVDMALDGHVMSPSAEEQAARIMRRVLSQYSAEIKSYIDGYTKALLTHALMSRSAPELGKAFEERVKWYQNFQDKLMELAWHVYCLMNDGQSLQSWYDRDRSGKLRACIESMINKYVVDLRNRVQNEFGIGD